MELAIIGSREPTEIEIDKYIPAGVSEIVSGGAKGIDTIARNFAIRRGIRLTEFLPNYNVCGRAAPIKRNCEIADYADEAIVMWNGKSKGTKYTISLFEMLGKKVTVYIVD